MIDMTREFPAVYIEWHDHWNVSEPGWLEVDEILEDVQGGIVVHTIGMLLNETDDLYVVSGHLNENGQCIGCMNILKADVKHFEKLTVQGK